jgi:hypothetical protein
VLEALIDMLVAVEVILAPAWVAAVAVRPPWSSRVRGPDGMAARLARTAALFVAAGAALVVLGLVAGDGMAARVLAAHAVVLGFAILLAGLAVSLERLAGPRAVQALTALAGWLIVASIFLVAPVIQMAEEKAAIAQAAVAANPLAVAEHALGLDWMHRQMTYVLTPLGESYAIYYASGIAWWKTALGYLFVGSGLVVFGISGVGRRRRAA